MRLPPLNCPSVFHRRASWIAAALLGTLLCLQPAMAQDGPVGADYRKVQQMIGSGNLNGASQAADAYLAGNAVEGAGFRRPAWEKAVSLTQRLRGHGIVACLRDSAGQDIDGGCGQLRARRLAGSGNG